MSKYFLFYKHYNIAWGKINFSFIILPNGSLYYFNSPNDYLDILGFEKDNISLEISHEELCSAIEKGIEYLSTNILNIEINGIKLKQLHEDKSWFMTDSGYELYSIFKYNSDFERYEYIPLQIFQKYYSKRKRNKLFQNLIKIIDSYKEEISDKIETISLLSFIRDLDIDDGAFIGKEIK